MDGRFAFDRRRFLHSSAAASLAAGQGNLGGVVRAMTHATDLPIPVSIPGGEALSAAADYVTGAFDISGQDIMNEELISYVLGDGEPQPAMDAFFAELKDSLAGIYFQCACAANSLKEAQPHAAQLKAVTRSACDRYQALTFDYRRALAGFALSAVELAGPDYSHYTTIKNAARELQSVDPGRRDEAWLHEIIGTLYTQYSGRIDFGVVRQKIDLDSAFWREGCLIGEEVGIGHAALELLTAAREKRMPLDVWESWGSSLSLDDGPDAPYRAFEERIRLLPRLLSDKAQELDKTHVMDKEKWTRFRAMMHRLPQVLPGIVREIKAEIAQEMRRSAENAETETSHAARVQESRIAHWLGEGGLRRGNDFY